MIRAALAYLAVAVAGILMVTGLPFGGMGGPDGAVSYDAVTDAEMTVPEQPVAGAGQASVENVLTRAIAAGQSPQEIDALINAAANRGSVQVPLEMMTTEGRVDTAVLTAAVMAQDSILPLEQGDISTDDTYITPQTAILDIQDMTYVVLGGDSLAGLALKFYGNARLSAPIFEANRDLLATPDALREGQTIVIPSRSKL
jgi:nucleoid-associated protein YgaU